ncbi:hypothetical protein NUSPORA_02800 [Nucleospora cyclopteri]
MSVKIYTIDQKSIELANIYRPCSGENRTILMKKIMKKSKKERVFAAFGDWNSTENEVLSLLPGMYISGRNVGTGTRNVNGVKQQEELILSFAIEITSY